MLYLFSLLEIFTSCLKKAIAIVDRLSIQIGQFKNAP